MAVRANALQQDDLLTRYLEASRRRAGPRPALGTDDLLLARYLKAIGRYGQAADAPVDHLLRTCTNCGRQARFEEGAGGWAECSACGQLA